MYGHLKKLREKEETSRVGTAWTTEEEEKLINSIKENKQLADIAVEHKRTATGIRCRVMSIAVRMLKTEGKSIDYVSTLLHLTPEDIENLNKKLKSGEPSINSKSRTKRTTEEEHNSAATSIISSVLLMLKNQEKPTENLGILPHIKPEEIEELNKTLNPNDPMTKTLKLLEEIRNILTRLETKLLKE